MNEERLTKLINDFNHKNLTLFLRNQCTNYAETFQDLPQYDSDKFSDFNKLGEIRFDNSDRLVIVTSKVVNDLSERSGKKAQYEKVKKILREMSVYNAGFFVFYDNNGNFRFSLVYAQYEGPKTSFNNFRRFTYYVDKKQTNNTFKLRVGECDFASLEKIKDAFSVEKVNKEFYGEITKYYYRLIDKSKKELVLPSVGENDGSKYEEFSVRLIGRIIFCWFLKHKTSANRISLIPKEVLSSDAVDVKKEYYHLILEKLFFEVMNKQQDKRTDDIVIYIPNHKQIPFLNGGLFEAHNNDFYKGTVNNNLKISPLWFKEFFALLERYNFTIDENSTVDAEVSVDPEMLGRIFENLLAEIVPETGETARKATGSYYTPRVIVDYMVEQSLKQYLLTKTSMSEAIIDALLSYEVDTADISDTEKTAVVKALKEIKVVDPACGSGAFPMGILHRILLVLEKTDHDLAIWRKLYLSSYHPVMRRIIEDKLSKGNEQYIRKLTIIQDSIYGVDIQPIAVEIAKLRCFLSLVVDELVFDNEDNRGIEALPNLEFKFVAANTLIGLPPIASQSAFGVTDLIEKLKDLRERYLRSFGDEKLQIEKEFKDTQQKLYKENVQWALTSNTAKQLTDWDPFSYESCDWFDPDWMFGEDSFDIVIANPPYVRADSGAKYLLFRKNLEQSGAYKTLFEKWDLMIPFVEQGLNILSAEGSLIYITSNAICTSKYAHKLLDLIQEKYFVRSIDYFNSVEIFEAGIIPVILHIAKTKGTCIVNRTIRQHSFEQIAKLTKINILEFKKLGRDAFRKEYTPISLKKQVVPLGDICYMSIGMVINADEKESQGAFAKDDLLSMLQTKIHCRKYVEGKDIVPYYIKRVRYLEWGTKRVPGQLRRATFPELYALPKIMRGRVTPGVYDETGIVCNDSIVLFVRFTDLYGVENTSIKNSIKKFNTLPRSELEHISIKFNLKYLLAVLNSSFAFSYLNNIRRHRLENYFYPDDFRKLPMPDISGQQQKPFVELVDEILNITKEEDYMSNPVMQSKVRELEREIDILVYQLYELAPEEIAVVEGNST
ncbi:MAG: TaqI-like C-terminal specificity domain-containing protein [Atribacterota bacterium]|nr:TaqI-like C-terminal specificity domain-containing protein [Atribacterota bacterium]